VAVIIFRKIIKTAVVVWMITIVLGDVGFLVGGGSIINVGAGTIVNLGDGTTGNVAGISALWVVAAVWTIGAAVWVVLGVFIAKAITVITETHS
jgi:hypothetical protein